MKIKLINLVSIMFLSSSAMAQHQVQAPTNDKPLFVYCFACLSIVLLVIIVLLLRKKAASDHHNQQQVSDIHSLVESKEKLEKLLRNTEELVIQLDDYKKKLDKCLSNIEGIHQKIEDMEQKISTLKMVFPVAIEVKENKVNAFKEGVEISASQNEIPQSEQNKINPTDVQSTLAKCEGADGHFYLREAESRDRKTLYKIFEKEGRHLFTIDKNNQEAISNALSFYDVYLDGYCESSNAFPADAKSIEVLPGSEGKLLREDDRYKVIEKLKVKFI